MDIGGGLPPRSSCSSCGTDSERPVLMANDEPRQPADAGALDDEQDRKEIRDRYYGLMQELRVVVTGAQVLLAFLLTVPFAQGFARLDAAEPRVVRGALVSATLSVIAFITPTAMHRYGKRTAPRGPAGVQHHRNPGRTVLLGVRGPAFVRRRGRLPLRREDARGTHGRCRHGAASSRGSSSRCSRT